MVIICLHLFSVRTAEVSKKHFAVNASVPEMLMIRGTSEFITFSCKVMLMNFIQF